MSTDIKLCLQSWGLKNIQLRPYQVEGVEWFISCVRKSHGGILADEMGLGKTVQTICAILSFKNLFNFNKFIVISPLSVMDNWKNELHKFAPNLKFLVYMGDKDSRSILRTSDTWKSSDVILLTTYEFLIKDAELIDALKLDILFMDEGHRIKNKDTVLYKKVMEMSIKYRFLLTGTPIQNNLNELYNLLYVVSPEHQRLKSRSMFIRNLQSQLSTASDSTFDCVMKMDSELSELILRRIKANVLQDLPEKMEVVIFHGLTELQKRLYKSCLTKDVGIFQELSQENPTETKCDQKKLLNILMQVRKCVLHPYLFSGVEKEPFHLGEHIVENSVKMQVIDQLLKFLLPLGHKVLIFSQMTKMLDIIQDFCFLRGLEYERLDGSVRSEERFAAISKFSESKSTRLFLLSTRAGGQGLNLTAADTVVFVDSDFNPQVDLQAMARIHRPGQERPCRTIRLVTQHSVEEMIVSRAQQKLVMTRTILGHEDGKNGDSPLKVKEMLCYGLNKLFSEDEDARNPVLSNEFFTSILGETDSAGHWKTPVIESGPKDLESVDDIDHIYLFEGTNYKAQTNRKDYEKAADMVAVQSGVETLPKKKKSMARTDNVLKARENRLQKEKNAMERRREMWRENEYESCQISPGESEEEDEGTETVTLEDQDIHFVVGDVTHPCGEDSRPKIICQLTDDSGMWGSGGVFSSIDRVNPDISVKYLMAAEMEDLSIGDTHIYPMMTNVEVALLVAQSRDKNGRISPVRLNSLEKCFKAIQKYALKKKASVHLPRLGYKTPQFNWYGVEKLINKHLVEKGVDTFVYYYRRNNKRARSPSYVSPREKILKVEQSHTRSQKLSDQYFDHCFFGVVIFFDKSVAEATKKELTRHILAFDGDVASHEFDTNITHYIAEDSPTFQEKSEVSGEKVSYLKVDGLIQSIQQRSILPPYHKS